MRLPAVAMETNQNYIPKAQIRPMTRQVSGRSGKAHKTRKSQGHSSSEEDFHSDDNLRPYEEVKMAHHDKKLNGLGLTGHEYIITPVTPLLEQSKIQVHQPMKGRTHSTASTSSKGRLYSYVSGSDGDIDDNDTETAASSSSRSNKKRNWRRGSRSSLSSNDLDTSRMTNERVSQLSLSDSDHENRNVQIDSRSQLRTRFSIPGTTTMPLPPPTVPPPPPPPIEDIPQRGGVFSPNIQHQQQQQHIINQQLQQQLSQQQQQQQRHLQFGPQIRGNYATKDFANRDSNCYADRDFVRRQYSDPGHCGCSGNYGSPYSEGDVSDFEPHYLVQTSSGNVFIPLSQVSTSQDGQAGRYPRTVPRSGSIPVIRVADLPSPNTNGVLRPMDATTVPRSFAPTGDVQNLVLTDRLPNGTLNHEYQEAWDTSTTPFGQQFCPTSPTVPYSYPTGQNMTTQDFGFFETKFHTAKHEWKKKLRQRCSWKCFALITLVLMLLFLGFAAYFATEVFREAKTEVPVAAPVTAARFQIGVRQQTVMPPKSFWHSHFTQQKPKFVKFNFSIPGDAIVGVYGRRGAAPTIAQFDYFEVIDARTIRSKRSTKSSSNLLATALTKYMEQGVWFLAIYNDKDSDLDISFNTSLYDSTDTGCPGDCRGHGDCVQGQCQCYPGYTGWDCLQTMCPILCSNNGMYIQGQCQCHAGWKGRECEVRENECVVPNCNGNGRCINGICECNPTFQGPDCGIVDCRLPNCSGYGVCVLGQCVCYRGHTGTDCSIPDKINITRLCAKNCSGHGVYNVEEGKCECQRHFTGIDCETEICRLACYHGECKGQKCVCDESWSGLLCDQLKCDHRCGDQRGTCNNGTCECNEGWNGKHCSMDGCPKSCSNNGVCHASVMGWGCNCHSGWKGAACDIRMETQCKDHADNDEDGLRDCMDPDCCASDVCTDDLFCRASPDPAEILLRKQPPSTTASFYEKVRFLVEENSVQMETSKNSFNESQASVIRGKIHAKDGTPLIGVKVDVDKQPLYGYTRTRELGLFDILVNGGGSVTLQFSRQPFLSHTVSVLVPWNQIITMETVVMVLTPKDEILPDPSLCGIVHDHNTLQPVVLSTWQHTQLGSCPERSTIIPESQVLQESISIPGTNINLVYHSSETPGYRSVIMIQMTPHTMPHSLALVHLRVSVEGIEFEKTFEADPELKYKYAWDRRNAYRQRVYGIVPARVNVGYQYSGCDYVFWETRSTTMSGFDLTSSEIGHWTLDLHHTYNFQEGILHKGDGTNIYLKEKPKKLVSILGSGQRRRADCDGCNGPAVDNRLLAPLALASSRDGSLYVWDYNFIRKLSPGREEIASILQIGTYTSHKPYMTVSPVDSRLYIADYMNLRIIHVKTMGPVRDLQENFEVVAGTGEECTPGERELCGDGKMALTARFLKPKGIAINKEGVIYVADGANIRMIDTDRIISTVIGSQDQPRAWKPMSCDDSLPAEEVRLHWPTALAIDPLDDTLHILDGNIVVKLTKDNRVVTVAGRPITCPEKVVNFLPTGVLTDDEQASSVAAHVKLVQPESLAFGPHGDLYIVESDTHHINRVRHVTTDGRIHHFAGTKSKCDCQQANCRCYDPTESSAAQALFEELTAITVTPDGIVHFADSGNLRVFSVISELPVPNWMGQYEVISTETKELYIFNRYGQHQHTVNIMTDQYQYNFTYNINSFHGRLVALTDNSGKSIQIERDYDRQATEIISPTAAKCKLQMDNMQRLQKFSAPDNSSYMFTYDASSGLLLSKQLSDGKTFSYMYDEMGRLLGARQPTGEIIHLHTDVNSTGSIVHVTTDNSNTVAMATYGSVQSALHGSAETKVTYLPDGAVVVVFPSNLTIALESAGHPVLENQHRMHFKRKLIAPNKLVHRLEWRFYLRRKGRAKNGKLIQKLGRRMRVGDVFTRHDSMLDTQHVGGYKEKALLVNGENLLTIEYDRDTHTETVLDKDLHEIITTAFDNSGLPTHFLPARNHHSLNITYNAAGEIIHWKYGDLEERRIYEKGLLKEKTGTNGALYRYQYRYGRKPTDIHLPSGLQYYLQYDNEGNLKMVRTPGLGRHYFSRLMITGAQRVLYHIPTLDLPYIEDYNGQGRLLQVIYPSEYRKVIYRYNHFSQLAVVLFGDTEIRIQYNKAIAMMSSVELKARGHKSVENFKYDSSMVDDYELLFPDDYRLLDAKFQYVYDKNFRLSTVHGTFSQNQTTTSNYSYDDTSGVLKHLKYLKFQWPLADREKIFDDHIVITREMDLYGRLQKVQYMFRDNTRYVLNVVYDEMNRISRWERLIGQTDMSQYEYRYDIDGNVIDVLQNGETEWQYGYDNNGNLNKITEGDEITRMTYDRGDKISTLGQRRYKFDLDGFMIQRHDEDLLFNSNGQLTSISNSGSFKYSYNYDYRGRMIVQRDRLGNIMQYFYADVGRPELITHTYNHTNLELTQYFYDSKGVLIMFERQDKLYYIGTDPIGSPIVIFSENGLIVKQLHYDPLGLIISDTNPNFEFSFGFQGGVYNPTTKLVHYERRIYDTMFGHYVNPDYQDTLRRLQFLIEDPIMMNNYQYRYLVNSHLRHRKFPTLDITEWLKLLGFDLNSLAPDVSYDGTVRPPTNTDHYNLLPTSSAFECTFHRDMKNMLSISTVPHSRVSPRQAYIATHPAPLKPIFGSGVVMSVLNHEVIMNYIDSSPDWSKKLSRFLNNSKILDFKYTIQGREVLYIIKPDASAVDEELRALGIHSNAVSYENEINVTVNRLSHPERYRMHSYEEIDVRLHGNNTVINIRYGSNYDHERQRILRHAKERAMHRAWAREKWLIQNSLPSYHSWTEEEKEHILTEGYSESFDVKYIHSPTEYPEIADDCNNIKFVKVKR